MKPATNIDISHLKNLQIHDRIDALPLFLKNLFHWLNADKCIVRFWIFGSRARGDHKEMSDWDLAFEVTDPNSKVWLNRFLEISERAETLLKVDAVIFNEAPDALKENILRDGILVFHAR